MQKNILQKFNVTSMGEGKTTLVLAHGFGSDQTAWRYQIAELTKQYRLVLFDHLGCGRTDTSDYNPLYYNSFQRYADDILEIYAALGLTDTIFVGHSASAMIGMLASRSRPEWFRKLVFVSASPRYLNENGYTGGFEQADLNAMYEAMASNYLGWANGFGPVAMGNPDKPALGEEFARTLSAMRPDIAQSTARLIFESDFRSEISLIQHAVLILQAKKDVAVPVVVGDYLAAKIPYNQLVLLEKAEGHLAHLSSPQEVTSAIQKFVADDTR